MKKIITLIGLITCIATFSFAQNWFPFDSARTYQFKDGKRYKTFRIDSVLTAKSKTTYVFDIKGRSNSNFTSGYFGRRMIVDLASKKVMFQILNDTQS